MRDSEVISCAWMKFIDGKYDIMISLILFH
jgi:hypothetical protein